MKIKTLLLSLLLCALVIIAVPYMQSYAYFGWLAALLISSRLGDIRYGLVSLLVLSVGTYIVLEGYKYPTAQIAVNFGFTILVSIVILYVQHLLKQRKTTLRKSEEKYKAFISSSSEAIWRFKSEKPVSISLPINEQIDLLYMYGYLAECNDAMARTYGYESHKDIVGTRLSTLMPYNQLNIDYLTAFIKNDYSIMDAESSEVDKNGKRLYILNSLIGQVENGFIDTAWGVQRNITEQVLKQQAVEMLNNELEYFVHAMLHDIQDPIRLIYSYVQLTLEKDRVTLSEDGAKYLESVYDAAKRIEAFTDALLLQAQSSKQTSSKVLPTTEVLEMALKNLEFLIQEKNATIEYSSKEILNVDVDATSLMQIFQNLISNSIKYSKEGVSPVVKISCRLMYQYVQFTVEDNGRGIPHTDKNLIFNIYTLPPRGHHKSGVGLRIVRKLVNSYDGRLTISSEEGQGTTIYFTLPKGEIGTK